MRLWTIAPSLLDTKGLLALWRESLLALHVLSNQTKGYKNHPQLFRFKAYADPLQAINLYLGEIYLESQRRGYHFDAAKFDHRYVYQAAIMPVNTMQIAYEFRFLQSKLVQREPQRYQLNASPTQPPINRLFYAREGPIEAWEHQKLDI